MREGAMLMEAKTAQFREEASGLESSRGSSGWLPRFPYNFGYHIRSVLAFFFCIQGLAALVD